MDDRLSYRLAAALAAALCIAVSPAPAQHDPPVLDEVTVRLDSGPLISRSGERSVIWSDLVHVSGAATMQLHFSTLRLGAVEHGALPTLLRITSLLDGAHQTLDVEAAKLWCDASAWFNGDTLLLELIADGSAAESRITLSHARYSAASTDGDRTICGPTDDRLPSTDVRVGRVMPNGCTAWLINDSNHCMITAGHCASSTLQVIEFNYPLSDSDGNWQHAHPDDQYVVDVTSIQALNAGTGSDWGYFGCFANTNTGLTAFQAQGASFILAGSAPPADNRTIRITGNGSTDNSVPPEFNRAQKTHTGQLVGNISNRLSYTADTSGGNSGSPVIDETTGEAIGVHTHGGCTTGGGANQGTAINHPAWQTALANPLGICGPPQPTLTFNYPAGVPALLDPAGDSIPVEISGAFGGELDSSSPMLHINSGDGFLSIPLASVSRSAFEATTPPIDCGATVQFYFSAQLTTGQSVVDPNGAPVNVYEAIAAIGVDTILFDNGEVDLGWTVDDDPSLETGSWERGVPAGGGDRGDPRVDYDGSGACWLTELANGNTDVDGGATRLVSPLLDLTTADDPRLTYVRWFYSDATDPLDLDRIDVHVSDDDGQSWIRIDRMTNTQQWIRQTFALADHIALTDQVRIRFTVIDDMANTTVEGAVDAIHLYDPQCKQPTPGDIDGNGAVNVFDLIMLLKAWGLCPEPCPPSCAADITNSDGTGTDCMVDAFDLTLLLLNWTP